MSAVPAFSPASELQPAEQAWRDFRSLGFDLSEKSPHDLFVLAWNLGVEAIRAHKRSRLGEGLVGKAPPEIQFAIRQRYANEKITQVELAREYGLDQATVNRIIRGRPTSSVRRKRAAVQS